MPENDKLKFSQLDEITRAQMDGSDYAVGYKDNGDNKKWTFENQADFLLNDSDAGQEFQETFVKVQDTEPSDENNKIWVKETPEEEVEVPTYDEFEAVVDDIEDLKSALKENENEIFDTGNEITIIDGNGAIKEGGVVTPLNYFRHIVLSISSVFIDGVATLKRGSLGHVTASGIYAVAYMDKNMHILSYIDSDIASPHSFNISDVPNEAIYVAFNQYYDEQTPLAVFSFQSPVSKIEENREDIATIQTTVEVAGKYQIETAFSSANGYYDPTGSFITYPGIKVSSMEVNAGDVYYLTSNSFYGMARVVFFNQESTFVKAIRTSNDTALYENTRVVAPEGAKTMLLQAYDNSVNNVVLFKADISEKLAILSDDIQGITDATTTLDSTDVSLTYESATGYYNKNKGFDTYSGVTVAKVSVQEGQSYLLTSRNYYNAAMACLLDSNDSVNSVIWLSSGTAEVSDYKITIPAGISKLMVQRVYAFEPTKLKLITGIKAKNVGSLLKGKRITVIGDSITELNLRAKTNWVLWIKDWCGAQIQNLGASGTGFIAGGTNPYSNRISRIDNPDIIGIACSFNDMSNSIADLTTAAESFFDALITAYPAVPIICYVQSPWSAYHYGIENSDQWINALREVCQTRGIPFYDDMYKGTVLKPWLAANRAVYYINDGEGSTGEEDWVHPNSDGHKVIARYLYPKFVENLVTVGLDYGIE